MIDLTTHYLGLKLRTPLVPSASPLSQEVSSIRRLEDAGASAVVLYSLFRRAIAAGNVGARSSSQRGHGKLCRVPDVLPAGQAGG